MYKFFFEDWPDWTAVKEDIPKRKLVEIMRKTIGDWVKHIFPKRFQRGNHEFFGFKDRSEKYNRYKGKKKHHRIDLKWSGKGQEVVMASLDYNVDRNRATIKMRAPKYFWFWFSSKRRRQVSKVRALPFIDLLTWHKADTDYLRDTCHKYLKEWWEEAKQGKGKRKIA